MALRKAVAAETLELAEGLLGEVLLITAFDHAVDQLVLEPGHAASEFKRGHGAAKLVCLTRREAGAFNCDSHRLFLEQRHAQGFAKHLLKLGLRKHDRFFALAPAQIRVDHVALNRPWAHDSDLDDEIIERARFHPRQHRHLGAAFDLEGAERIGLPDHGVSAGVFRRNGR